MMCPYCHTRTSETSKFCHQCGKKVPHIPIPIPGHLKESFYKKSVFWESLVGGLMMGIVIGFALAKFDLVTVKNPRVSQQTQDSSSLQSQDNHPLASPPFEPFATQAPSVANDFPLDQLEVTAVTPQLSKNQDKTVPLLSITIHNHSQQPAGNIRLRVDFFRDEQATQHFDTQYLELLGTAQPGESTLSGSLPNFGAAATDTWYDARIVSAHTLSL